MSEDERALISQASSGNLAALDILYSEHRDWLLSIVRAKYNRELKQFVDPEDLVQDIWLHAIRGIGSFREAGAGSFRRWLSTIALNVTADRISYVRIRAKKVCDPDDLAESGEFDSMLRLLKDRAVHQRSPSKSAASHELFAALDKAISGLPIDQASAIRLRYLEGLNTEEASQRMNRSKGSVIMLCSRALRSLRWEMRSISLYT